MSEVAVTVAADAPPAGGAPPEPAPTVQSLQAGPTDEAKEAADLNAELVGVIKAHHDTMIADAKGEPPPKADEAPEGESDKPAEEEGDDEPNKEPQPTLTKARRRMALAKKRQAEADQLISQARAQSEQLQQLITQHAQIAKLWSTDPVKALELSLKAAGADEDAAFGALAEHRLKHGTGAERKAKPAAADDAPAWAVALREEWAELKKAQEEQRTQSQQAAAQQWLRDDTAACQRQIEAAPSETPYFAAEPPEDQSRVLGQVLKALHDGAAKLRQNPNDSEHLWVKHFTTPDRDSSGKVTRTPVQKLLGFLDQEAKKRYEHRYGRIQQLLPAASADASGGKGATPAGERPPVASGAKAGQRKLGGANVAANTSARRPKTDEEEAAELEAYLRSETS